MSNSGDFSELLETVRLGVLRGDRRHETIVYGHVTAYDSQHNSVKVKIYPGTDDGGGHILETEYMPLFTPWSGNGWGFQAGPILDQMTQCAVHILEEGDGSHFVYATFFHDQHKAPGAPSKELWIVHEKTKTYIKLQNDGSLREGGDVRISFVSDRVQSITDLGDEDLDDTHKVVRCSDLNKFIDDYNNHTHPDPQGGTTGAPTSSEPHATCSINTYAK